MGLAPEEGEMIELHFEKSIRASAERVFGLLRTVHPASGVDASRAYSARRSSTSNNRCI